MCWFFKKKKVSNISHNDSVTPTSKTNSDIKIETKQVFPAKEDVKPFDNTNKSTKPITPTKTNKESKKEVNTNYSGKYEVYQEAGSYKYRLKASNGEILAVSLRYTTERGALLGIDTFKKNVEQGVFDIYTDKNGFSQYHLYTNNKSRVIIVGEFYNGVKQAESAVDSVKKFYNTLQIDIIEKLPDDEVREELVEFEKIEESTLGKYEIYKDEKSYYIRLKANNSQVLFVSSGYSSKPSAKKGLETIKSAIEENRFSVSRDKQNRYQFNLYSSANQLILTGETYSQKSNCISAINSVRKFAPKAKIIEL
ncbi:MAG: YegP family protein [Candidatus Izemoplasmatales bacterium]